MRCRVRARPAQSHTEYANGSGRETVRLIFRPQLTDAGAPRKAGSPIKEVGLMKLCFQPDLFRRGCVRDAEGSIARRGFARGAVVPGRRKPRWPRRRLRPARLMQQWKAATPLSAPSVIAPTIPRPAPSLAMTVVGIGASEVQRSKRRRRAAVDGDWISSPVRFVKRFAWFMGSCPRSTGMMSSATVMPILYMASLLARAVERKRRLSIVVPSPACPLKGAQRSRAGDANWHQRVLCVECVIAGIEQTCDDNLRDTRILTNPTVE